MAEVHGEGYECVEHCGKKFAKKKLLNAHLARVRQQQKKGKAKLYNFRDDDAEFEDGEEDLSNRNDLTDKQSNQAHQEETKKSTVNKKRTYKLIENDRVFEGS